MSVEQSLPTRPASAGLKAIKQLARMGYAYADYCDRFLVSRDFFPQIEKTTGRMGCAHADL